MANLRPAILPLVIFGGLIGALVYSQRQQGALKVSGFVEADQIRVGSRVGGRVREVQVEEGQRVEGDAVLLVLEPYDLIARQAQAQAELQAAQADFQLLTNGLRPEEVAQRKAELDALTAKVDELVHGPRQEKVATARALVSQAEAQLELAQQEHTRTADLLQSNTVSQDAMDKATSNLLVSEAVLEVRKQELGLLIAGTREEEVRAAKARLAAAIAAHELAEKGYREEEIAQAEARMLARRAALEQIAVQLAELQIRAPSAGVVEALDLQPGDLVAANAPVLSLMDTRKLWVRAYVPENHLNLSPGQSVEVTVDSYPDRVFPGVISFISRQAEFTPGNVQTPEDRASKQVFRIKVALEEGLDVLRPGMAADVWLEPRR